MIELRHEDDIAVVELARGRGNSLDQEFLEEIRRSFASLREDPPRGVVLTAHGKIFCAGLDLPALVDASREELVAVLAALASTLREVFTFPRPVVAAINGHAVAGGALLSLACDRRLMAMGEGKWGLTEARLGLVVPASMIELSRYSLERRVLERLVYGGQAYPAFKAREMGILDDLVEAGELPGRARELVEAWTPVPAAFADIKARLKAPAVAAMDAAVASDAHFLERWFSPVVRARVQAAVERLGERS